MAEERVGMSTALRGAQEALARGQYQEVVKLCKIVLKQNRNNYDGCVLLGSALFQLQEYVQAEKALRVAVGINASKLAAWQRLVALYEATEKREELVEACEAARDRARAMDKMDQYYEYARRLVAAHSANSDYEQACGVWQEILDSTDVPEDVRADANRGLADAKAALLEINIQKEFKRRVSQLDTATLSSSGPAKEESLSTTDASPSLRKEDILRTVEEEFAHIELSKELEIILRKITSQTDMATEAYHELLLRLLLRRVRAARCRSGKEWKYAKLQAVQQCVTMISSYQAVRAFEVMSKFLEDDDGDEAFVELQVEFNGWKQRSEPASVWFGKLFAHVYPWHGLALAAIAFASRSSQSESSSLERQRLFCEMALRLEDDCATGWQVLAEVHEQQRSHSNALECVRRGLQSVARSRDVYGSKLRIAELRLHLTLGEAQCASQHYVEAHAAFQYAAEEAKSVYFKEGQSLLVAGNEGLAKVALAQGHVELAHSMLRAVLSLNAHNHWALAELGWLAFKSGDQKEALEYLEQAVSLQPRCASYRRHLGLVYWEGGGDLRDKALQQFLESVKQDPGQSDVFRYLGHYYRDRSGDLQRAARCYQKSISLDPEDAEAGEALCDLLDSGGQEVLELDICRVASQRSRRAFWAWRRFGFLKVHRKEWTEAAPSLQHALRGYVTDGYLWEALGLAYQHLGMLTAALKAYGRATSLQSQSPVFSLLQSGNILLLLASYRQAVDMFQEARTEAPHHVGVLCGLAAAMLGRARECLVVGAFGWSAALAKEAAQMLSESATTCSNVGAYWKLLGDLEVTYAQALPCEIMHLVHTYTYDVETELLQTIRGTIKSWHETRVHYLRKATQSYQRALHLSPSEGGLYSDLGVAYDLISSLEAKKADKNSLWLPAVRAVCGGLSLDGDNPDLWVTLGLLAPHKGLRQHSFIQALRIDGTHAFAWGGLGQLYVGEGHEDMAREAFDRARSANPALPLPWAGMAAVHSFLESEKDVQEAFASCLYAVQLAPTVEVQLGLVKLAARTQQMQTAEVYTAVELAVQRAPKQVEAHCLKGLICESRGDIDGAIRSLLLARSILALLSNETSGATSQEDIAVSLNLARVLCKAGEVKAAIHEYEKVAKIGLLEEDAGALRGYAVALWEYGSKENAVAIAKKSAQVARNSDESVCGLALVVKMTYSRFGPSYALREIQGSPREALSSPTYFLSSLAVASVGQDKQAVSALMRNYGPSFTHDIAIRAQLLAAASQQVNPGEDTNSAIQTLKKALHLHPQSSSLRARLGRLLLDSNAADNVYLANRCCEIRLSRVLHSIHYGSLCSTLAAAGCACALCGNVKSVKLSHCNEWLSRAGSLRNYLESWVHKEPWNIEARWWLVLNLFQEARAQNFPFILCQALRRMTSSLLPLLSSSSVGDSGFEDGLRMLLLLTGSECSVHIRDNASAVKMAKAAANLSVPSDKMALVRIHLARCYAAQQDFAEAQAELSNARRCLNSELDIQGWMALIGLEKHCNLPDISSTFELCKKAITNRSGGTGEKNFWMSRLLFNYANGFIKAGDLRKAQKLIAEASVLSPESTLFHLLHGALCLQLALRGSNAELFGNATRSFSKAMVGSRDGALPLANLLLCQAQAAKGNLKTGEFSKWERRLWTEEWSTWPSDGRPAQLYFQMGVLAKKAQGTLLGIAGTVEFSWGAKSWLQRSVHLRPDSLPYWTTLQE